jgi:hypothetical protein
LLYILLIAVLIVLRNLRPRRIKVSSLWISPIVMSLLSIYVLAVVPDPTPIWLRTLAGLIGVILGGMFGFFRGKVTPIRTGELPATIYVGPSLAASFVGSCVRSALLGPNECASIANPDGADGWADSFSTGVLRRDVLDDSPQIRTAEGCASDE